jgi:hypothetical protein
LAKTGRPAIVHCTTRTFDDDAVDVYEAHNVGLVEMLAVRAHQARANSRLETPFVSAPVA